MELAGGLTVQNMVISKMRLNKCPWVSRHCLVPHMPWTLGARHCALGAFSPYRRIKWTVMIWYSLFWLRTVYRLVIGFETLNVFVSETSMSLEIFQMMCEVLVWLLADIPKEDNGSQRLRQAGNRRGSLSKFLELPEAFCSLKQARGVLSEGGYRVGKEGKLRTVCN